MLSQEPLDRAQWQALIPHQGGMCLLDQVEQWDDGSICCTTRSHASTGNPLRRNGRLSALHLAEYGAQAMAIHGGLLAARENRRAPPGYLASLREVRLHAAHIDQIGGMLEVRAEILARGEGGWMYRFRIQGDGRELAQGRVSVIHQGAGR
jgi:predicted hotdog family 3-hydroxylacyl-ACP dehydratase